MRLALIGIILISACGSQAGKPAKAEDSARPAPSSDVLAQQAEQASANAEPNESERTATRDLVAEAGRAELRASGLLIDVGSADMHKYSRGGWQSGWSRNRLDGKTTVALIDGKSAFLDVVLDAPALEVVVRAKGPGSLGVALPGYGGGKSKLGSDYKLHRFAFGKELGAGRHRIVLTGKKVSIDWIWLAEVAGEEPPVLERATADSLLAPTPRSYDFYLIPSPQSQLDFASKGADGSRIEVIAQSDAEEPVVLLTAATGQAHHVSLSDFAGKPTRIRLRSTGTAVSWLTPRISEAPVKEFVAHTRPQNVIMLLIDTQRADSFSIVDSKGGIGAEAYESLVKTSTTFRNAYNQENWTKPSIASLNSSLYPDAHLARWRKDFCSKDLVFLSEHLQSQGFATAALIANMSGGRKFGFDQGWDHFEKTDDAKQTFGQAQAWLRERDKDKRFFLFVQTIDPHVPFSVPKGSAEKLYGGEYKGKLGDSFEQREEDALNDGKLKLDDDDRRWLQALYDAEVLYQDKYLGLFLDTLRAAGTLQDTAFVIVNDHGEEFGEHGRYGHGWSMGDALFRSPLLMHLPGFFPTKTFDEVVEHIDVAPTIVDALGVSAMDSAQGQSLLPLLHNKASLGRSPYSALLFGRPHYRAIRVGDYKLLLHAEREHSLFNVREDPLERNDRFTQMPIAVRLCELALGEAIANPARADRLADRSILPKIRAEYIKN